MNLYAILLASSLGSFTPDDVRQQFPLFDARSCTDNVSGERGLCFLFMGDGAAYLVFVQNDEPVFMRLIVPGQPYEEVWRAAQGISL